MNKRPAKKNVRETALELLETIDKNQSYSNILLNHAINKNQISDKDIGLLTELTYGTLQRRMSLDYFLQPFIKNPRKIESWVMHLLRLTLYQMLYLDKIPDHAALNEAVEIAKKRGHKGISSMVNGVLRNVQRQGVKQISEITDPIERLSIKTSHPKWLVKRWVEQFGYEETEKMCELNLTAPTQTARVNRIKATREEVLAQLEDEGFAAKASPFIPEAIHSLRGNLAHSNAFKSGLLTIQDESSMLAAYALAPGSDEIVLDACAAPGGKSTHISEKLGNTGKVIALDLHDHKVKLIADNANRLGLENVETKAMDSRKVQEVFAAESFDRILLDAPCSGLGVMRRKPDMKYTKKEADLLHLKKVQINLLRAVSPLLKKGGILVYSTCTVDKSENQEVVTAFLQEQLGFEGDESLKERMPEAVQSLVNSYELQILPQHIGSDGFYIACLRKKVQ
ncbi:16S rRNA (cytosine(967)-C(5))-methyltransferase RsmB [Cytobacillus horneckiae]|uniref:16S rRNA (cytosine(967)-C(5))-methyltransferase RsmB n=1 Tax=Cytobacillus horneckiae TaxID=549687 RepID=UPI003D9A4CE9